MEKAKCKNCTDEMIEEMAYDIYWQAKDCDIQSVCEYLAKILVNAGYRNCKDKVVLSKEEYEELKHFKAKMSLPYRNISKETAEKILKKGEEFYKMSYHKSNAIHRLVEWIKDTFGVEVEE